MIARPPAAGGRPPVVFIAAGCLLAASLLAQNEAPPPSQDPSDLVKAAASAKEGRKSSRPVITNETLKKSTRGLTMLPHEGETAPAKGEGASGKERAALRKRLELLRETEIPRLRKRVATAEAELARVEHQYYAELDPVLRDDFFWRKYETTRGVVRTAREKLDAALQEEADLDERLKPIGPP